MGTGVLGVMLQDGISSGSCMLIGGGGGVVYFFFFFFKQKTAYEIRNCDWSSDVCSSDLYCLLVLADSYCYLLISSLRRVKKLIDSRRKYSWEKNRQQNRQ